ncbi:MAG TPA: hypothetical protein VGQ73_02195 [Gemmatimonadales bacterium]|nr:hypothetical protein [Gemmatimonadales bacterium]
MSHSPDAALLNEHQRRHLGITLGQMQQLLHEIGALLNTPAPQDGLVTEADDIPSEFMRRAPQAIAQIDAGIAALAERFELPRRERSRFRWARAVLGISIDNLEDSRAGKLRAYGEVNPELAAALDPELFALQSQLRALLFLLESRGSA